MWELRAFFLAAAVVLAAFPVRAQEAWPPALPGLVRQVRATLRAGMPLNELVVKGGIGRLADKNFAGLGTEAERLRAWAQGREGLSLSWEGQACRVTDSRGESVSVSASLSSALSHMNQFFNMLAPALEQPMTFEELKAAALSEKSVARVQGLFDRMLDQAMDVDGIWLIPEIGGEATLDRNVEFDDVGGEATVERVLEFHEIEDASRPIMREIASIFSHPDGALSQISRINELYRTNPLMADVDDRWVLRGVIEGMPAREARGLPAANREKILRIALKHALSIAADSWTFDPAQQFVAIVGQEWSGRYVGLWHTHPPLFGANGWGAVEGPSDPDMENASRMGQFMTVSFHPEGFDLYDLSALEGLADSELTRSKLRKISYRSPSWREHFQQRHKAFAR